MERLFFFCLLLFHCYFVAAQKDSLECFLVQANFFKLKQALQSNPKGIDKNTLLYYRCFVDNAFNRNREANEETDLFFKNGAKGFSDTAIARLLAMQAYSYANIYQYYKAAEISDALFSMYPDVLSGYELKDAKEANQLFNALKYIPAQSIEPHSDVLVPIHHDEAGMWILPVSSAGDKEDFIFDTGAGISTISQSIADRMKVKRLGVSVDIDAIQGSILKADIGVADCIMIGTMKIQNVAFIILPDSLMRAGDYIFPGNLGYPVIKAMKEVQLSQNGTLPVPATSSKSKLHNLFINRFSPIIFITTDSGDSLMVKFDTGGNVSLLYDLYFNRYKDLVMKSGEHKTFGNGGFGGVNDADVYEIKNFGFRIGSQKAVLKAINVFTQPVESVVSKELNYGNFGEDMIRQFGTMTINFEDMFVDFN